jgi:hypothetical protein
VSVPSTFQTTLLVLFMTWAKNMNRMIGPPGRYQTSNDNDDGNVPTG